MRISIALQTTADCRVVYAGDPSKWSDTAVIGDKVVGEYSGALFNANGTTKKFDWDYANSLGESGLEEQKRLMTALVQDHLDKIAQSFGYDNIYTAVTYADEPAVKKFQDEGRALRSWRSEVWAACHAILGDVLAGLRTVPTADELIAELPDFVPPGT